MSTIIDIPGSAAQYNDVAQLESSVIKKTNKYVYLIGDIHMSYSDFHKLKTAIRHNKAREHSLYFASSKPVIVESYEEMKADAAKIAKEMANVNWEKMFRNEAEKVDKLNNRIVVHGRMLYKDLASLPILKGFIEEKGIKFIIQQNRNDEYRMCFDPYKLMSNFHSSLSEMYRDVDFYTKNGGWMTVDSEKVVLYDRSGDYGVYDDAIAIEAAKKLFPRHVIESYAGQSNPYTLS